MTRQVTATPSTTVRLHIQEFSIPPVRDCLVIGRESAIGCVALKQALALLHGEPFEDLHPKCDTIGDILIRATILQRIPRDEFVNLIVSRVAPLMGKHEIVLVNIEAEVILECQL